MSSLQGKKLLVQGAIYLLREVVREAHKQGAHVTVIDYLENSPAKKQADRMISAGTIPSLGTFQAATMVLRKGFTSQQKPMRQTGKSDLPVYFLV